MSKIEIIYIVDDVQELKQTYDNVEVIPEVDDVSQGFIEIVGEEPTREERRS